MATITDITASWSAPVALTAPEIWQARWGSVYLSTSASPGATDGILLTQGQALCFETGVSVRYRRDAGPGDALVVREILG